MKSKEVIVEFSTASSGGDGSNEKEYLLQLAADLYDALYRPGGNPQAVKDVKTKIEMAGGTVKILHGRSVPGSSVRELDGTFQVVMYHPKYFKQGYLIRLVGDNPEGVAEVLLNEASSDEAWELVGQPVPEIQQFVKQMGYGDDEQSVEKITQIINSAKSTQIPVDSIPKLKNLANKGNDPETLKAILQISSRPDSEQQYIKLMQARDASEGRKRDITGYIKYVKSGNYEPPVLLKLPTGLYVVGGRTRLYAAIALGVPATVKILSADNFKQGVAEGQIEEKWSEKYKRSINCSNPKGFSQRAHCQGRKKHNEDIVKVSGGYELRSKKTGRNLGKYSTRAGAEKRERQVQYFKHAKENINEGIDDFNLVHSAIKDLLPIAMTELGLKHLPKIHIKKNLDNNGQPSFGVFNGSDITLAVSGRHPVDICRTLAHELTHYSQGVQNKLDHESGKTGSPEENEANSTAGIIMRKFSMKHPEYMKS